MQFVSVTSSRRQLVDSIVGMRSAARGQRSGWQSGRMHNNRNTARRSPKCPASFFGAIDRYITSPCPCNPDPRHLLGNRNLYLGL